MSHIGYTMFFALQGKGRRLCLAAIFIAFSVSVAPSCSYRLTSDVSALDSVVSDGIRKRYSRDRVQMLLGPPNAQIDPAVLEQHLADGWFSTGHLDGDDFVGYHAYDKSLDYSFVRILQFRNGILIGASDLHNALRMSHEHHIPEYTGPSITLPGESAK